MQIQQDEAASLLHNAPTAPLFGHVPYDKNLESFDVLLLANPKVQQHKLRFGIAHTDLDEKKLVSQISLLYFVTRLFCLFIPRRDDSKTSSLVSILVSIIASIIMVVIFVAYMVAQAWMLNFVDAQSIVQGCTEIVQILIGFYTCYFLMHDKQVHTVLLSAFKANKQRAQALGRMISIMVLIVFLFTLAMTGMM